MMLYKDANVRWICSDGRELGTPLVLLETGLFRYKVLGYDEATNTVTHVLYDDKHPLPENWKEVLK